MIPPDQLRQFQAFIIKLLQWCHERSQFQCVKFDLPDAELRCLMLFDGERNLTPKNISGRMNVVKSRVTKVIEGLAKKDFIKKIKDPDDARIVRLSPTSRGLDKIAEIKRFNDNIHEEVLLGMNPEQRKIMLTNLTILQTSLESSRRLIECGPITRK